MFDRDFDLSFDGLYKEVIFFVILFCALVVVVAVLPFMATPAMYIYFGLMLIRIATWVLAFAIPMFRKMGYMAVDLAKMTGLFYTTVIKPFVTFFVLAYRFIAKRERPQFESSSQGQSRHSSREEQEQYSYHQQSHESSSQQREDDDRFRKRQEQRKREEEQKQKAQGKREEQGSRSCFDILGITPDTDYATAKKAHRDLLKKYHPDRVNDLGPELQDLATKKIKEINTAWEGFQLHWNIRNG